jgi:hypothetical protein
MAIAKRTKAHERQKSKTVMEPSGKGSAEEIGAERRLSAARQKALEHGSVI